MKNKAKTTNGRRDDFQHSTQFGKVNFNNSNDVLPMAINNNNNINRNNTNTNTNSNSRLNDNVDHSSNTSNSNINNINTNNTINNTHTNSFYSTDTNNSSRQHRGQYGQDTNRTRLTHSQQKIHPLREFSVQQIHVATDPRVKHELFEQQQQQMQPQQMQQQHGTAMMNPLSRYNTNGGIHNTTIMSHNNYNYPITGMSAYPSARLGQTSMTNMWHDPQQNINNIHPSWQTPNGQISTVYPGDAVANCAGMTTPNRRVNMNGTNTNGQTTNVYDKTSSNINIGNDNTCKSDTLINSANDTMNHIHVSMPMTGPDVNNGQLSQTFMQTSVANVRTGTRSNVNVNINPKCQSSNIVSNRMKSNMDNNDTNGNNITSYFSGGSATDAPIAPAVGNGHQQPVQLYNFNTTTNCIANNSGLDANNSNSNGQGYSQASSRFGDINNGFQQNVNHNGSNSNSNVRSDRNHDDGLQQLQGLPRLEPSPAALTTAQCDDYQRQDQENKVPIGSILRSNGKQHQRERIFKLSLLSDDEDEADNYIHDHDGENNCNDRSDRNQAFILEDDHHTQSNRVSGKTNVKSRQKLKNDTHNDDHNNNNIIYNHDPVIPQRRVQLSGINRSNNINDINQVSISQGPGISDGIAYGNVNTSDMNHVNSGARYADMGFRIDSFGNQDGIQRGDQGEINIQRGWCGGNNNGLNTMNESNSNCNSFHINSIEHIQPPIHTQHGNDNNNGKDTDHGDANIDENVGYQFPIIANAKSAVKSNINASDKQYINTGAQSSIPKNQLSIKRKCKIKHEFKVSNNNRNNWNSNDVDLQLKGINPQPQEESHVQTQVKIERQDKHASLVNVNNDKDYSDDSYDNDNISERHCSGLSSGEDDDIDISSTQMQRKRQQCSPKLTKNNDLKNARGDHANSTGVVNRNSDASKRINFQRGNGEHINTSNWRVNGVRDHSNSQQVPSQQQQHLSSTNNQVNNHHMMHMHHRKNRISRGTYAAGSKNQLRRSGIIKVENSRGNDHDRYSNHGHNNNNRVNDANGGMNEKTGNDVNLVITKQQTIAMQPSPSATYTNNGAYTMGSFSGNMLPVHDNTDVSGNANLSASASANGIPPALERPRLPPFPVRLQLQRRTNLPPLPPVNVNVALVQQPPPQAPAATTSLSQQNQRSVLLLQQQSITNAHGTYPPSTSISVQGGINHAPDNPNTINSNTNTNNNISNTKCQNTSFNASSGVTLGASTNGNGNGNANISYNGNNFNRSGNTGHNGMSGNININGQTKNNGMSNNSYTTTANNNTNNTHSNPPYHIIDPYPHPPIRHRPRPHYQSNCNFNCNSNSNRNVNVAINHNGRNMNRNMGVNSRQMGSHRQQYQYYNSSQFGRNWDWNPMLTRDELQHVRMNRYNHNGCDSNWRLISDVRRHQLTRLYPNYIDGKAARRQWKATRTGRNATPLPTTVFQISKNKTTQIDRNRGAQQFEITFPSQMMPKPKPKDTTKTKQEKSTTKTVTKKKEKKGSKSDRDRGSDHDGTRSQQRNKRDGSGGSKRNRKPNLLSESDGDDVDDDYDDADDDSTDSDDNFIDCRSDSSQEMDSNDEYEYSRKNKRDKHKGKKGKRSKSKSTVKSKKSRHGKKHDSHGNESDVSEVNCNSNKRNRKRKDKSKGKGKSKKKDKCKKRSKNKNKHKSKNKNKNKNKSKMSKSKRKHNSKKRKSDSDKKKKQSKKHEKSKKNTTKKSRKNADNKTKKTKTKSRKQASKKNMKKEKHRRINSNNESESDRGASKTSPSDVDSTPKRKHKSKNKNKNKNENTNVKAVTISVTAMTTHKNVTKVSKTTNSNNAKNKNRRIDKNMTITNVSVNVDKDNYSDSQSGNGSASASGSDNESDSDVDNDQTSSAPDDNSKNSIDIGTTSEDSDSDIEIDHSKHRSKHTSKRT